MIISKKTLGVLLLTSYLLIACDSDNATPANKQFTKAHKVIVSIAHIQTVQHKQIVTGSLEAINTLKLYSEENSRITSLPLFESDHASSGDILVTLDNQLIQADLDKAIALVKQAKVSLKRLKKLQPKKLASEEDVTLARTTLDVTKAEQKRQRARLSRTTIRATFDGVISQRNYEPGDVIAANSHILTLIDPKTLRVRLQLSEQWVSLVKAGSSVDVRIDALGDQVFSGTISRIYPTINPSTRKGTLEITLAPTPDGARAGQLARVNINTQATDKLVVPSRSIHHDIDGAHVFIINDEMKAQKVHIQQGLDFGEVTEILSGVSIDDKIVSKGFLGLRNNKTVVIQHAQDNTLSLRGTKQSH